MHRKINLKALLRILKKLCYMSGSKGCLANIKKILLRLPSWPETAVCSIIIAVLSNTYVQSALKGLISAGVFNLQIKDYIKLMKTHHTLVRKTMHDHTRKKLTYH
jgi:hypothetical protein